MTAKEYIEIINCVAQAVMALAAVFGVIFVTRQLRRQNEQSRFEALMAIHERVGRQDFRDALGAIYMAKQEDLDDPRSRELFKNIRMVAAVFDLLGAGVQEGLLPKDATLCFSFYQAM
jgi:hypothetical protein